MNKWHSLRTSWLRFPGQTRGVHLPGSAPGTMAAVKLSQVPGRLVPSVVHGSPESICNMQPGDSSWQCLEVLELWQWDLHITSAKRAKIIADCVLGTLSSSRNRQYGWTSPSPVVSTMLMTMMTYDDLAAVDPVPGFAG